MKAPVKVIIFLVIAGAIAFAVKTKFSDSAADDGLLTLYGNVDIRQVSLGFRVSGRVATMALEEGDAVAADQVLATLDKGPLEDSLALYKAQLAVAQAERQLADAELRALSGCRLPRAGQNFCRDPLG